jgi:hypothetical protein
MGVRGLIKSLGLAALLVAAGSLWGERAVAQQTCYYCDYFDDGSGDWCWHCKDTGGIGPEGYSDCAAGCRDGCFLWNKCNWT